MNMTQVVVVGLVMGLVVMMVMIFFLYQDLAATEASASPMKRVVTGQ